MEIPHTCYFFSQNSRSQRTNQRLPFFLLKSKKNNLDLLRVWTWTTFPSVFWMRVSQPLLPQQTIFGFSGVFCNNWQHAALAHPRSAIGPSCRENWISPSNLFIPPYTTSKIKIRKIYYVLVEPMLCVCGWSHEQCLCHTANLTLIRLDHSGSKAL